MLDGVGQFSSHAYLTRWVNYHTDRLITESDKRGGGSGSSSQLYSLTLKRAVCVCVCVCVCVRERKLLTLVIGECKELLCE